MTKTTNKIIQLAVFCIALFAFAFVAFGFNTAIAVVALVVMYSIVTGIV